LVVNRLKPTDYYECTCGIFPSGLVPRKIRLLAEQYQVSLPRSKLLTKEKQRNVKALLKDYYSSLVKHVTKVRFDVMILDLMQ